MRNNKLKQQQNRFLTESTPVISCNLASNGEGGNPVTSATAADTQPAAIMEGV